MNDSIITRKEQLQATQHALDESEKPTHDQAMQLINANEHVETVTQINQAYQQWMHALDRLEDAIFMHDKDFRILRCNRAYQQYAKLPFEQIIGQFYFDIFPKTEAPLCSCLVSAEEIMLQGNAEEIQVDDAIFNSYAYAIRDEEGTYLYSVHTIENITERKQAEQALLISSQKNRLLFESSRDALMTISPPLWHFTRANTAARQLFGISDIAEITSLGVLNISPEYQLDGDLSSVKAQQIIATAMEQGSNFFEWTHQRFNGDNFIADVLLTRMEVEGEDPFLQVTIRDISERKEAEQQIQQLTKIYATLSLCNHAITNSNTSQDLFEKICVYSVQA